MIKNKDFFIQEAKDFLTKYKLPFEYRDNFDEKCKYLSKTSETLLYYNIKLDLGINLNFDENSIMFSVQHYSKFNTHMPYDIQELRCRLYMILEYIDTHKKLNHIKTQLTDSKIHLKWKSKTILDKLSFLGEMENKEDEYNN